MKKYIKILNNKTKHYCTYFDIFLGYDPRKSVYTKTGNWSKIDDTINAEIEPHVYGCALSDTNG